MKRAVFVDWNGTLSNSKYWGQLEVTQHPRHAYYSRIRRWLFVDNQELIDPWMRGIIDLNLVLNKMAVDIQVDREALCDDLKYSCTHMAFASRRTRELLAAVRRKASVVLATDNMDTFRLYTVPALGLEDLFDDMLISSELGVLKGDIGPELSLLYFDNYLKAHKLNYDECVLLDDVPDSSGHFASIGFERKLISSAKDLERELEALV